MKIQKEKKAFKGGFRKRIKTEYNDKKVGGLRDFKKWSNDYKNRRKYSAKKEKMKRW